jgi:WD40 repeat protein
VSLCAIVAFLALQPLTRTTCFAILPEQFEAFDSVAFTADGKTLGAASSSAIHLWETATWKLRTVLPYGGKALTFSRDGRSAAIASAGAAYIIDAATGARRLTITPRDGRIHAIALAPDGRTLAAGEDHGAYLVDAHSGRVVAELDAAKYAVHALAFSPDGGRLAVGAFSGSIALWDVGARKRLALLTRHAFVNRLAFSADGTKLASGAFDRSIRVWDVATSRPLLDVSASNRLGPFEVALSPEGKKLATVFGKTLALWDAATGAEMRTLRVGGTCSATFSPDGRLLAAGLEGGVVVWRLSSENLPVREWKLSSVDR